MKNGEKRVDKKKMANSLIKVYVYDLLSPGILTHFSPGLLGFPMYPLVHLERCKILISYHTHIMIW